jgi:hypothetical protein
MVQMGAKFRIPAIFALFSAIMFNISCGVVVKDPDDINGRGEVTLVFEVTGSVSSAGIVVRGNDGIVLLGIEAADGNITPETVDLPWTSEKYTYTGMENVFFSISAQNSTRKEQAAGTATTYNDNLLIDAGAQYTSYVSAGDYAYNEDDEITALITAVDSDTQCTLDRVFFAESWRTYYIYQAGSTVAFGTTTATHTGGPPYKLIDSGGSFENKVEVGDDTAANQDDNNSDAYITDKELTSLDLDAHIFQQAGGGEHYLIRRDVNTISGTSSSSPQSYRLIDSSAEFINDGVAAGLAVKNITTPGYAQIVAVNDGETLTLDKDLFSLPSQDYLIYPVKSSASHSTTQTDGKLIDSSASYWEGVKAGDVIYNPDRDMYGKVVSVDDGTQLTLDTDVFPSVNISYKIYTPRTLTVTVYADGEEFDSFTSTHWDILEAALTGVIDTTAEETE